MRFSWKKSLYKEFHLGLCPIILCYCLFSLLCGFQHCFLKHMTFSSCENTNQCVCLRFLIVLIHTCILRLIIVHIAMQDCDLDLYVDIFQDQIVFWNWSALFPCKALLSQRNSVTKCCLKKLFIFSNLFMIKLKVHYEKRAVLLNIYSILFQILTSLLLSAAWWSGYLPWSQRCGRPFSSAMCATTQLLRRSNEAELLSPHYVPTVTLTTALPWSTTGHSSATNNTLNCRNLQVCGRLTLH